MLPTEAATRPPQPGYAAKMPAGTPLYLLLAADVRERIVSERLAPHTPVPSERELAELHGVSRMTARQALALLESEGLVYRSPPRGTFVAEPRVRFHVGSFSEEVTRMGRRPAAQQLWADVQPATPAVGRALGIADGAQVHVFHRLRTVDDVPFALETTYLPADLTPGILDEPAQGSLWEALRCRYGVQLACSTAVLESIVLDDATSMRLGVRAGSAGTLLTRRTEDVTGRCVEHGHDIYRADRAAFEVCETIAAPSPV